MVSRLFLLLLCGIISARFGNAQKLPKVKKLNMKVNINATGDTLIMKFIRPNNNLKLEGFILGYGSNFFSNQYVQWPENGKSYVTEVDAEPRYLIAVKPNENNKKSCKEKNSVQKPLQLVIGTLTPSSVFLSWGILINPQIDWSALNKCPNDRFYTVRYREKNKDWLFQLCPTTETVIDNLKPNTMYEFSVKDNTDDGIWSKCQNHKTIPKSKVNGQNENTYKIPKGDLQVASEDTKAFVPIVMIKQGIQNVTNLYQPKSTNVPPSTERVSIHKEEPKKPLKTTTTKASTPKPKPASKVTKPFPTPKTSQDSETEDIEPAPYKLQLSSSRPKTSVRPRTRPAQNGTTQGSIRARANGDINWIAGTIPGGRAYDNTKLLGVSRNISMEPNNTGKKTFSVSSPPHLPVRPTSILRRILPNNVTGRPGSTGSVLVPRAPSGIKPNRTTVNIKTPKKQPTLPPDEDTVDATVFSPNPKTDVDVLGKPRYTGPHVVYVPKPDLVPCSITDTLKHFPTEDPSNQEATKAPENPPSNLTVVTVEGCPSFVILDWEQPDNDTVTEYEVVTHENGAPPGKDTLIITTNQTHSTVEDLKPNTNYSFQVTAKNALGAGPPSPTLPFNTESADPRVSESASGGKDAIWTEIKFKSDIYSECRGKQYVKRTWYKKFVGIQLCNSLRYKMYLSDTLSGTFYNIGDQSGYGEDHCQFVDSFLDGRTGQQLSPEQLTNRKGFYRSVRQQPVEFGEIGERTHSSYVHWYECGVSIPGKW